MVISALGYTPFRKNEVELSNSVVTSSVTQHFFPAKVEEPQDFFSFYNITNGMEADMDISGDLGQWINSLVTRNVQSMAVGGGGGTMVTPQIRLDPGSEPVSANELKDWLFDNKFDGSSAKEKTCDPLWGSSDTQQVKQVTTSDQGCSSPDSFSSPDTMLFTSMMAEDPVAKPMHPTDTISSSDDLITLQPLQPLQPLQTVTAAGHALNGFHSDVMVEQLDDSSKRSSDEVYLEKMMQEFNKPSSDEVDLEKMVQDYLYDHDEPSGPNSASSAAQAAVAAASTNPPTIACDLTGGTTIIGAGGTHIRISGLPPQSMAAFQQVLANSPTHKSAEAEGWSASARADNSSILESALRGTLSNAVRTLQPVSRTLINPTSKRTNGDLKDLQMPFPVNGFQSLQQQRNLLGVGGAVSSSPYVCETSRATSSCSPTKLDKVLSSADTSHYVNSIDIGMTCGSMGSSSASNASRPAISSSQKKENARKRKYAKRCAADAAGAETTAASRGRLLHFCPICSKGFKDKYSVNVHIRTHTGEKPFQCDLCSKCFRQKAHLAKHVQIHNSAKPPPPAKR